jgi:transposase InsO family protein
MADAGGRRSRGPCREVRERLACVGSSHDRRDDARRWPRGVDFDGRASPSSTRALAAARIPGRPQVLGRAAPQGLDDPPTERNRVWQTDFSEFETTGGGIWRICAVIDYATKYCLAAKITPTGRGSDALACLDAAVVEAERVLG